jgi:hypothetical protein
MPSIVLTNASISINGVDLSDRANNVSLNYEVEAVEDTTFGNTGRTFTGGLQNITCDIEFMQDYAASEVEATIYPLVGTRTTVIIRPVNVARSTTNPEYTITNTYLAAHTPVSATVGELATTSLSFQGGSLAKVATT